MSDSVLIVFFLLLQYQDSGVVKFAMAIFQNGVILGGDTVDDNFAL